jgi:hypothetical protein
VESCAYSSTFKPSRVIRQLDPDQGKKAQKLKKEIEQLEKYKNHLVGITAVAELQSKESHDCTLSENKTGSENTNTHGKLEGLNGHHHNEVKTIKGKVLPNYDFERLQKLTEELAKEDRSVNRRTSNNPRKKRRSNNNDTSQKDHSAKNSDGEKNPPESERKSNTNQKASDFGSEQVKIESRRTDGSPVQGRRPVDSARTADLLDPKHKLEAKREEVKRQKSNGSYYSESPEKDKDSFDFEEEKKLTFEEKMKAYDYDAILSKAKKQEELDKRREARENRNIGRDRKDKSGVNTSGNELDKSQRSSEQRSKDINNRSSSNSYGRKSSGSPSNKFTEGESKKLVPIVSEKEKNDIFAKIQQEENRRRNLNNPTKPKTDKKDSTEKRLPEIKEVLPGKSFEPNPKSPTEKKELNPRVDHQNPNYLPASLRETKLLAINKPLPRVQNVSSSKYGVLNRSKDNKGNKSPSESTSKQAPVGRSNERKSRSPGDANTSTEIRVMVNNILVENKIRVRSSNRRRWAWTTPRY